MLHTERSDSRGGQQLRIASEIRALRKQGHTLNLACRKRCNIAPDARSSGATLHILPFRASYDLGTMLRLKGIVRQKNYQLIHTHSSVDSWIGAIAARMSGIPLIRSRHTAQPVKKNKLNRWLYTKAPRVVITSSELIRQHLIQDIGCPAHKVVTIPPGADSESFHKDVDGSHLRREWGYGDDIFLIGMVAALHENKGHDVLLDAFKEVLKEEPKTRLLLVGEGRLRTHLSHRINAEGLSDKIRLTGYRNDVPEILSALQMFVLPSTGREPCSQVIPQAMLVGCPVLCTDSGALPELIDHHKEGLIAKAGDPVSLHDGILEYIKKPDVAKRYAFAARARASNEFTFKVQTERTLEIYRNILNERKSGK